MPLSYPFVDLERDGKKVTTTMSIRSEFGGYAASNLIKSEFFALLLVKQNRRIPTSSLTHQRKFDPTTRNARMLAV